MSAFQSKWSTWDENGCAHRSAKSAISPLHPASGTNGTSSPRGISKISGQNTSTPKIGDLASIIGAGDDELALCVTFRIMTLLACHEAELAWSDLTNLEKCHVPEPGWKRANAMPMGTPNELRQWLTERLRLIGFAKERCKLALTKVSGTQSDTSLTGGGK